MIKPTRRLGRDRDGTFNGLADARTAWAAVAAFVFFLAASASEVIAIVWFLHTSAQHMKE